MKKLIENLKPGDKFMDGNDKSSTVQSVTWQLRGNQQSFRVTMEDGQDFSVPPNTVMHVQS